MRAARVVQLITRIATIGPGSTRPIWGTRRPGLAYPLDVKWASWVALTCVVACASPAPPSPTPAPATELPAASPVVVLTVAPRSVPVVAPPTLQPVGVASPVALPLS